MSKASRKGASFERLVADYMAAELGQPIDRRVKCGSKDKGDIAGFKLGGFDCIVECKNKQRMELSEWLGEAERERINAEASFGVVAHHRRGCGKARIGDTYVSMTLDTWLDITRTVDKLLDMARTGQ